ncbi:MAG: hypothetical protein HYT77_03920 [Deltaproteobacteria bacterium]|nr:hypothetical protein [Deltaproteobacteria bacterium]
MIIQNSVEARIDRDGSRGVNLPSATRIVTGVETMRPKGSSRNRSGDSPPS